MMKTYFKLVYTLKFCITFVFQFLLSITVVLRETEKMVMQNFRGLTTCIMVYVKMVNSSILYMVNITNNCRVMTCTHN